MITQIHDEIVVSLPLMPDDLAYVEAQQQMVDAVVASLGVPRDVIEGESNYSGIRAAFLHLDRLNMMLEAQWRQFVLAAMPAPKRRVEKLLYLLPLGKRLVTVVEDSIVVVWE